MSQAARARLILPVAGLSLGLLAMGALRLATVQQSALSSLAGFATPGYVLITVFFTIRLVRVGLPLDGFGFGAPLGRRELGLALAAIAALRLVAVAVQPWIEGLLGTERNLERFSGVEGSIASLLALLLLSWTFAAFGEEFAYRIVLMRGLSSVFGDTRPARFAALLLQATLFGLVHAYQGPVGIVGATISGLVFGAVTLAGRWSIWPAALAHGVNNTFGILSLYSG
jgi:membrane protease YdiL (CAAX protease family)